MKQHMSHSTPSILMLSIIAAAFSATLATAQNPVPQVVGPPHPQAVAPGGASFTLKVYGANFVPGSVVNWNRHPRATTYVSGHEVHATILGSDIVKNTAGYITVTNPLPGGGVSSASWTLVEVHAPTATIKPGVDHANGGAAGEVTQLLVADFNNDGTMDLADADTVGTIPVYLGNTAGTFKATAYATLAYWPAFEVNNSAYGDFNGDGNIDIAYQAYFGLNSPLGLAVALGEGNGKFRHGWYEDNGGLFPVNVIVGDFNGDGKLDLITGDCCVTYVYLGNGDGTFHLSQTYEFGGIIRLAGDFNGDGKLDLVMYGGDQPAALSVALGNGDGTFQVPQQIATPEVGCSAGPSMLVNDLNGDGKLDIVYCDDTNLTILLGNGDGTFQQTASYAVDTTNGFTFTAGDFNSDGKTDLIVSDDSTNVEFSILLGNGDGTFQPQSAIKIGPKYTNGESGIAVGDFNSDGLLDFIFEEGGSGFIGYLQVQP